MLEETIYSLFKKLWKDEKDKYQSAKCGSNVDI